LCLFFAHQHVPHTTNFDKLVEQVVSCGGEDLKRFLDSTGRNAVYTSHIAVVDFIEALGIWVEEFLLKRRCQAFCFSIMADKCINVATMEEISMGGTRGAFFLEMIHLKKADAESCSCGKSERELADLLRWVLVGQAVGMCPGC